MKRSQADQDPKHIVKHTQLLKYLDFRIMQYKVNVKKQLLALTWYFCQMSLFLRIYFVSPLHKQSISSLQDLI